MSDNRRYNKVLRVSDAADALVRASAKRWGVSANDAAIRLIERPEQGFKIEQLTIDLAQAKSERDGALRGRDAAQAALREAQEALVALQANAAPDATTLPDDLAQRLDALATRRKVSRAEMINYALGVAVGRLEAVARDQEKRRAGR